MRWLIVKGHGGCDGRNVIVTFLDGFVALVMVVAMVLCSGSVYGGGLVGILDSGWDGRESRRQVMSSDARLHFLELCHHFALVHSPSILCNPSLSYNSRYSLVSR